MQNQQFVDWNHELQNSEPWIKPKLTNSKQVTMALQLKNVTSKPQDQFECYQVDHDATAIVLNFNNENL